MQAQKKSHLTNAVHWSKGESSPLTNAAHGSEGERVTWRRELSSDQSSTLVRRRKLSSDQCSTLVRGEAFYDQCTPSVRGLLLLPMKYLYIGQRRASAFDQFTSLVKGEDLSIEDFGYWVLMKWSLFHMVRDFVCTNCCESQKIEIRKRADSQESRINSEKTQKKWYGPLVGLPLNYSFWIEPTGPCLNWQGLGPSTCSYYLRFKVGSIEYHQSFFSVFYLFLYFV